MSARQMGLGRGLAALLPDPLPAPVETDRGSGAMAELSSTIASELAANESGLAIIYRALDALVAQFGLDDAAIVIDEPSVGRQVFRAGRRPFDEDDTALLVAPAGLYTEPALTDHEFDRSLIVALCVLALRMDVLRYDAWHDPLTGLFDRRSFDRLLEMAIARSVRYGWPFTLVILDLDGFKSLNDRLGHAAGDKALRELGERFRRALRFGDNAARIGGDEFAMILPNTDPSAVAPLLERVATATGFESPAPQFSYGVAQCPGEAKELDVLFRLADERLYAAKGARQ